MVQGKTKVGGTKNLNLQLIHSLNPDLIIANKEENELEQIKALQAHYPVWVSDIENIDQALDMIKNIGAVTGTDQKAAKLVQDISSAFSQLKLDVDPHPHLVKTAYLIWRDPYMAAGGNTFINAMMQSACLENSFAHLKRYPTITLQDIENAGCELLLLSSEPFPFKQKHVDELQAVLPGKKILLADGEMFSWYGSRLLIAPAYFKTLWNEKIKQ